MPEQDGSGDAQKYQKFKKVDGATYEKVNTFLRKRTYVTAREWAIARLCADFKTTGGSEMTFIGEHLPELVPFMTDTYTPQAVNQARSAFKRKVKKAGATLFYGAMCGFFTAEELDDILFEASEVAKFLLEVEGTSLEIDEEISIEDRITDVMRNVAESAAKLRRSREEEEKEGEPGTAGEEKPGGEDPEMQAGEDTTGAVRAEGHEEESPGEATDQAVEQDTPRAGNGGTGHG